MKCYNALRYGNRNTRSLKLNQGQLNTEQDGKGSYIEHRMTHDAYGTV